jgi:DNA sulfur modification protein DndE
MTWQVFGGEWHEVFLALLKEQCVKEGLGTDDEILGRQFLRGMAAGTDASRKLTTGPQRR